MNQSEILFQQWCELNRWTYCPIPKEATPTPDYLLTVKEHNIYAEVKEIVANDEEILNLKQLEERGWGDGYGEEPGKTIRGKIKKSYGQIRRFARDAQCSGILVLYNNTGMPGLGRLDHYDVLTGMFGLQTVPVHVPKNPTDPVTFGADYLGSKKSLTETENRYLSGIMTLYQHPDKELMTFFYHNPHALFPIEPRVIQTSNCVQYKKSNTKVEWESVNLENR